MGSSHWCFHCSYSMPLYPSIILDAQFNTLLESVKALQESMQEMQANNARLHSSICHVRSLLQEEMKLDSVDADTEDAAVEIAMDSAPMVCISERNSDLIKEDSSSEDNFEVPSEMLDNPIESSRNNLLWSPPFIVSGAPLEFGDREQVFVDQVFDGNSQRNNTGCFFPFTNMESILIPLRPPKTETLNRNAAFLRSILNLSDEHQFAMYHCCWLDTGQKPPQMTLTGSIHTWFKCLGNEPATVGVLVGAFASVVEAGQLNLVDQMLDEMPCCSSNMFPAQQTGQIPDTLEFEHSTAAAFLSVESVNISNAITISSELNFDLEANKIVEADFVTVHLDLQPLISVIGDTTSEIHRPEALSIASIFTYLEVQFDSLFLAGIRKLDSNLLAFDPWLDMCLIFEKSDVVSSLFNELPENSGEYLYSLISKNMAAQHMLPYFPFDPGLAAGLMFNPVALVFDNSLQLNLLCFRLASSRVLGEIVPIVGPVFDTMSHGLYRSKFWGNIFWPMVFVRPSLGSLLVIDFSVKSPKVEYRLVLIDTSISVNGEPKVVFIDIGRDIAGLCCIGLDSRHDQSILILERHDVAAGATHYIIQYKVNCGTSLFSGFHSRGPQATLLAQVLDVLVESIFCYNSWVIYVPKGEFLSSIDPTEFFKCLERYIGPDLVKEWRTLLDTMLPMLAVVMIQFPFSIQVAYQVYIVTCFVEGETLKAIMLHDEMVGENDSMTFADALDISDIPSIITEPTTTTILYGLPNDVTTRDLDKKVANQSELDFKSKQGKDFISKPIVLCRMQTTCEGATSVASIKKCSQGALELYNLLKLVGYHPYAKPFVTVINSCLVLGTIRHGQQIHSDDISTGAIFVVAIVRPLFIIYSTSGCFDVAARDFEETEEADIVLCIGLVSAYGIFHMCESVLVIFVATLDCIRDSNVNATRGSGKCFVGSLMERLCVPNKWLVFLCILHTRTLQFRWFRNRISLVTEDPALIPTTLLENNFYGVPDAAAVEVQAFVSTAIMLRNDEHILMSNVYMIPIIVAAQVNGCIFFFGQEEHFGLDTMPGEKATHVVLDSNLEDKVLIESGSSVTNVATMEDPFKELANYLWDPG